MTSPAEQPRAVPLRFELTRDPEQFSQRAEPFLAERLERNVLATVLINARSGAYAGGRPLFAAGFDEQDVLRAVAMRTPPWPMLASEITEVDAGNLLDAWLLQDPELPGVDGQPASARFLAAAWESRRAGRSRCRMRQAIHVLSRVRDPARPAGGELRVPRADERELMVEWNRAFASDAGVPGRADASRIVAAQLARGRLRVWFDGSSVAMVAMSPQVAGVVRLGPVYTPPQFRRRGYASSAVAAACHEALAAGAKHCMLFTDLANPTSNKIYAEIGFRRFADWEDHAFVPA